MRVHVMESTISELDSADTEVSSFEFWHPVLFYIPVGFYYLWLGLKHWGVTLPTAANPGIYSGGMVGESKQAILDLIQPEYRDLIAAYVLSPGNPSQTPDSRFSQAKAAMARARLNFPLVAKPDQGMRGDGIRVMRTDADLQAYMAQFPLDRDIILQELSPYQGEAGVFYYRMPGEEQGRLFSLTLKEFPLLVGDGERTVRQLILAHPRFRRIRNKFFRRHRTELARVLAVGEEFKLVFAGNHAKGAIFRDGQDLRTEAMLQTFHDIASSMEGFYFGRFDVRYDSLEALQSGKGFHIIEVNGAGAEATHIWDPRAKLGAAYATLFEQFAILFRIGAANRSRGARPLPATVFLREFFRYLAASTNYPAAH